MSFHINTETANAANTVAGAAILASLADWLPWVLGVLVAITAIVLNIIAIDTKSKQRSAAILEKRKHQMEIDKLMRDED